MINIIDGNKNSVESFLKLRSKRDNKEIRDKVLEILEDVKENGDSSLFKYCSLFDKTQLNNETIKLSKSEIETAYSEIDSEFIGIIGRAKSNIEEFHLKQLGKSWMMTRQCGSMLGQIARPLENVGVYVPGGTASYPSSVLMNVIPAQIAGVKRIAMATPCREGKINPYTIVAANECGIEEIYKMGGVQAIGAFAFGTQSVPRVNKIVGPGNIYVATAKKEAYGYVDIDMIAGPSEILIIADETANEKFIAADMMSQAEHDELASSILITTSNELIIRVIAELEKQCVQMERRDIIRKSLKNYGVAILTQSIKDAIDISNRIAPEHLEVMTKNPMELLDSIHNAGSIFLGEYSPEPLGDYFAGPNHVLPTSGSAAFFSPLSVDDFIKKSSFIYYTRQGLLSVSSDIQKFAGYEGLSAHANSIKVRF